MGLKLGILVFASAPPGTPLDWAARLFPEHVVEDGEADPWGLPPTFAMLGTHEGRAIVVAQGLPWSIVSDVLMPGVLPQTPEEAWVAGCSRSGDVLVASMHSITRYCGHAVYRGGHVVLTVCRAGLKSGAHVREAEIPAWYPRDPRMELQPYRAYMEPEELEPFPELFASRDLMDSAFVYDENYVPNLAAALLGAPLREVFEGVKDWVRIRT
jgi:hypothetical protein